MEIRAVILVLSEDGTVKKRVLLEGRGDAVLFIVDRPKVPFWFRDFVYLVLDPIFAKEGDFTCIVLVRSKDNSFCQSTKYSVRQSAFFPYECAAYFIEYTSDYDKYFVEWK